MSDTSGVAGREVHRDETVVHQTTASRISWGGIIAGTICGIAIYVFLSIIGLSIGLASINPAYEARPFSGIAVGAGIWSLFTAIVAFFCGGLIAARLAGVPRTLAGILHGFTVWALGSLVLVWLATTTIGSAVTGVAGAMASLLGQGDRQINVRVTQPASAPRPATRDQTAGAGGQTWLGQVAQDIRSEAQSLVNEVISPAEQRQAARAVRSTFRDIIQTPANASDDLRQLFDRLLSNTGIIGAEDRQEAERILVRILGISEADAERIIENWSVQFRDAARNVEQVVANLVNELQGRASGAAVGTDQPGTGTAPIITQEQRREAARIVRGTAGDIARNPANALGELQQMLDQLFASNGVFKKEDAAQLLRRTTGLTEPEAERILNRWQTRYQAAVNEVQQAAEVAQKAAIDAAQATTDALAQAAVWAAFALFLAAVAATLGGALGRPESWMFVRDRIHRVSARES